MWTKSFSMVTKDVTKEQMWDLFADVNKWHTWDTGIEYAKIEGEFRKGNFFILKPKGGPKVKIQLIETLVNAKFVDLTKFPLAKMYGEHTFEETVEGLKLTVTMSVTGILGFIWRKLVAESIVNNIPLEMEQQIKFASKL